jgi:hypothetical protein
VGYSGRMIDESLSGKDVEGSSLVLIEVSSWPVCRSYSQIFYLLSVDVEGYCYTRSHSMTHIHGEIHLDE